MNKTVCIFGGAGFVGHYITGLLIEKGYRVRIVARHPQRNKDMMVFPGLSFIHGSPVDKSIRDQALKDCDVAINLIGILNEKGRDGRGFRQIHTSRENACSARSTQGKASGTAVRPAQHRQPGARWLVEGGPKGESAVETSLPLLYASLSSSGKSWTACGSHGVPL